MATVLLGQPPADFQEALDRRHALGLDLYDEVWEGTYTVAPAPSLGHAILDSQMARILGPFADRAGLVESGPFNLGAPGDYRVPDRGMHMAPSTGVWTTTAALVVEIVSPDDASWDKLGFYASHGVDEVVIVDPGERSVAWLELRDGTYHAVSHSSVLGTDVEALATAITWPDD
jgi:Uma2 family endonuclease